MLTTMILSCQDTSGGLSGSWFLILTLFIAWLDLSDGLKAWNVSFIFVRWLVNVVLVHRG